MTKETITYHDLDGNLITEDFYFNLYESEIVELNFSEKGGLEKYIEKITKAEDMQLLIKLFKEIVLMAYGERGEDGKSFVKSEAAKTRFSQTEAYSNLFMALATDDEKAAEFIKKVVPAPKAQPQDKLPKKNSKVKKLTKEEAEVVE